MSNVVQSLLARTGLAAFLGMQMNGNRNLYGVFGWNTRPRHRDFVLKYLRHPIAKRIINAPVNALWSDPPQVNADAAFDTAWQELLKIIPVFASLQRLDKLCGLGMFAIMVIGLDDGQKLDTPVNPVRDITKGNKQRKITYLQPYPEGSVRISAYETDPVNPRFGLPTMYAVSPGSFAQELAERTIASMGMSGVTFNVHWTRVLHVAEEALESQVFGHSRLECVYNCLDDLEKVGGSSAETFWLTANRGLHVNVDKEMALDDKDAEALSDEIDEYSNNLTRVIRTRGVDVNSIGSESHDPRGVFDMLLSFASAATGLPKRVLMGSEAGQLASQQDRANWSLRVEERISEYGNPVVMIPFIRMLINVAVLPVPKQLSILWPDAFKMNPLERAQTSAQMARSAANLSKTLKTVADLNHQNAIDSLPTVVPVGGGGFFGNATPPTKSKDPNASSNDPANAATITTPALYSVKPKDIVLLTEEECRSIIGFGKHMPVFDENNTTTEAVGSTTDQTGVV